MLNKEECEKALDNVARYCSDYKYCMIPPRFELINELDVLMSLIQEHFELVEHAKKLQDEADKYKHEYYAMCDLVENPQSYKFEDLKPGMWVWDEKEKKCNKIIEIEGKNIDFYYITESIDRFIVEFEENRFFPVTKALEYQK